MFHSKNEDFCQNLNKNFGIKQDYKKFTYSKVPYSQFPYSQNVWSNFSIKISKNKQK